VKEARSGFRTRVGVIVVEDGAILLARHGKGGRDYWVVPGGKLRHGEGVLDCARRELLEETGLRVEPGDLFCFGDFVGTDFHVLDLFLLSNSHEGVCRLGADPEDRAEARVLREISWHPLDRLDGVGLLPDRLPEVLSDGWRNGFSGRGVYLGTSYGDREKGSRE
jgi:8-oxo-dGTP diphosphatase